MLVMLEIITSLIVADQLHGVMPGDVEMADSTYNCNVEIIQRGHCVNLSGQSKRIINRFTLAALSAPLGYVAGLPTLVTNFIAAMTTSWAAFLSTGYLDDDITIRQMDDATSAPYTINPGLGNGTVGLIADMVAPDLTGYFKLATALRGKNYRGSKHLSPLNETQMDQGTLNAAAITTLKAVMNAFTTGTFSDGVQNFKATVQSQNLSQTAVNPTTIIAQVVSPTRCAANKTLGTQRHRRYPTLIG